MDGAERVVGRERGARGDLVAGICPPPSLPTCLLGLGWGPAYENKKWLLKWRFGFFGSEVL